MIIHIDDRDAFITVIEHVDAGTKYRSSYCSASHMMSDTQPACKRSDRAIKDDAVILMKRAVRKATGFNDLRA